MRGAETTFYILGNHFTAKGLKVELSDSREEKITVWDNSTLVATVLNSNTIRVIATPEFMPGVASIAYGEQFDGILHVKISSFDNSSPPTRLFAKPFKKKKVHYFPANIPPTTKSAGPIVGVVSPVEIVATRPLPETTFQRVSHVNMPRVSALMYPGVNLVFAAGSDTQGFQNLTWGHEFTFIIKADNGAAVFNSNTYVKSLVDSANSTVNWFVSTDPSNPGCRVSADGTTLTVKSTPQLLDPNAPPPTTAALIINVASVRPGSKQQYKNETSWSFLYNTPPGAANPETKSVVKAAD